MPVQNINSKYENKFEDTFDYIIERIQVLEYYEREVNKLSASSHILGGVDEYGSKKNSKIHKDNLNIIFGIPYPVEETKNYFNMKKLLVPRTAGEVEELLEKLNVLENKIDDDVYIMRTIIINNKKQSFLSQKVFRNEFQENPEENKNELAKEEKIDQSVIIAIKNMYVKIKHIMILEEKFNDLRVEAFKKAGITKMNEFAGLHSYFYKNDNLYECFYESNNVYAKDKKIEDNDLDALIENADYQCKVILNKLNKFYDKVIAQESNVLKLKLDDINGNKIEEYIKNYVLNLKKWKEAYDKLATKYKQIQNKYDVKIVEKRLGAIIKDSVLVERLKSKQNLFELVFYKDDEILVKEYPNFQKYSLKDLTEKYKQLEELENQLEVKKTLTSQDVAALNNYEDNWQSDRQIFSSFAII